MKKMRIVLTGLLLWLFISGNAQDKSYPRGYFRNPLDRKMDISGNLGEMRQNHYHMGLDLKTGGQQNLPVYAAADGYVARVKVEPFGFGKAIYINHPNGYSTVYAHLNAFFPELEAWVKQQQYKQESWAVDLQPGPRSFPVKKGARLGLSGNTGGSQAPHLHFEIRRTADDVNLNPLLFGLPLADHSPPVITRLALYNRDRSMYEQVPRVITLKKGRGSNYFVPIPLVITGDSLISFAIGGYDLHDGSRNQNGIYRAELKIDGRRIIGFTMDDISYNDTRGLNAHIDYHTRASGGPWLQLLAELPGYLHSIYDKENGNGVIRLLADGQVHAVKISVWDTESNRSDLDFKIRYRGQAKTTRTLYPGKMFYPLMLDAFESPGCEFYLGERCLYDSAHIEFTEAGTTDSLSLSPQYRIGSPLIPLQDYFLVRIKPEKEISPDDKIHVLMEWQGKNRNVVQPVTWQDGWASARFRDFGSFRLMYDREAPEILPLGFSDGANLSGASRIAFTVKDNSGSIKTIRTELDGRWICFSNDKGKNFIYPFDEKCTPGSHELKVSTEDFAGNRAEKIFYFVR